MTTWSILCLVTSVPGFYVVSSASQRRARSPGRKQYSPPRVTTNCGKPCSRIRRWTLGYIKDSGSFLSPRHRIFSGSSSEKRAIVHPLGLDELELSAQMGSNKREHQSPLYSVIFQNALG